MRGYVGRRVVQAGLVCLGISLITFLLLHVVGNPVLLLLPQEASEADVVLLRAKLGLDRPLAVQYGIFLQDAVRGDFGTSLFVQAPALGLILERMPATLELTLAGMVVAISIAIPLGVLSAVRRFSILDNLATVGAVAGQAMPIFWLGIMLIVLFAVKLHWLPASGRGGPAHLILPALTLGAYLAPLTMRLTRSGMLDILSQDYIRTARAKGVRERWVLFKHALRNAAIPLVTILGFQFGRVLGGAIVTETVFAWPGVASLAVKAIRTYDYPVVQASVVLLALIIVVVNLLTDLVIAYLDPRDPVRGAGSLMAIARTLPAPLAAERRPAARWSRLRHVRAGLVGLAIVALVTTAALFAPWLAPHDPYEQNVVERLKPPVWLAGGEWAHPLGTDPLGRDMLSRIIYGSRVSVSAGALAVVLSGSIGVLLGLLAGYFGGRVDSTISNVVEVMMAFPFLLLALAAIAILGPGFGNIVLVLGVTGWPIYTRVVRAETLNLREREFVVSARALGTSPVRVIWRHIVVNLASTIIVMASLEVARMIILESFLSFLGLGIPPEVPSWGGMLGEGRVYVLTRWWLATFPGLAIFATTLGINLLGDGLRDFLDPYRSRAAGPSGDASRL